MVEQPGDEMVEVRTRGMTRHLRALPRGQPRIEVGELLVGALVEHRRARLVALAHGRSGLAQRLDRLLERQITGHTVIDMPR